MVPCPEGTPDPSQGALLGGRSWQRQPLCLPGLAWLRSTGGRAFVSRIERATRRRGGSLVCAVPLVLSQLALRQQFPAYQDWADIATYTLVFMFGAVLIADRGFEVAIRRDAMLVIGLGIFFTLTLGGLMLASLLRVRLGDAASAAGWAAYATTVASIAVGWSSWCAGGTRCGRSSA